MIASLLVPACFVAVLADCEVACGEVREDNQWPMMSINKADVGYE